MARRRLRDPDPQVRTRNQLEIQGNPGFAGLSRIGGAAGGGGAGPIVVRGGPSAGQVRVEHVTLSGTADQTVANGGGGVAWDRVDPAPTELRGFGTLVTALSSGAVTNIPIDVTGAGIVVLDWKWGDWPDGYKMSGDIVLTRTRDGVTASKTVTVSPATRRGDGVTEGWEFRAGDTLTVTFPNGSGSAQSLAECTVEVMIWEVSQAASTVAVPVPASLVDYTTSTTTSNPGTIHLDIDTPTVSDGDLMVAILLLKHGGTDVEPDPTATGWTLQATEPLVAGSEFLLAAVLTKTASSEGASHSFDLGVTAFDGGVNPYGMIANVGPADVGTLVTASVDGTSVSTVTVPSMTTRTVHLYGSMYLAAGATGGTLDDATSLASTATVNEKQEFWQGTGGAARDFTFSSGTTDGVVVIGVGVSA